MYRFCFNKRSFLTFLSWLLTYEVGAVASLGILALDGMRAWLRIHIEHPSQSPVSWSQNVTTLRNVKVSVGHIFLHLFTQCGDFEFSQS